MHKHTFSIRKKLILSYVLILLISIVFYTFISYRSSSRYLKAEKTLLYTNSAASICHNIETQLHSYSIYAMVVSSNLQLQNFFSEPSEDILAQLNTVKDTIEPLLYSFQTLNPAIQDLRLYTSASGIKVHSNYIQIVSPDQMKMDTIYRSEYPWQFRDNAFVQHASIFSIYAHLMEPVCYLEIVLDASDIFRSALADNETGLQLCIYTEDEQLVWSNSQTEDVVPITRIPIENTTLTVDFSMPAQQFYAGINDSAVYNIMPLLLLCLVIFGILIFFYSHEITKNIQTLTDIISSIDQSNLDINIDMKQNNEISVLADCLNEMLKRINLLVSDIYQAKESEKQAELEALRTQINPHFLYNTMDVINWMAISGDTESICSTTGLISRYYRTMLNHGEFYTTFAKELDNIRSYISIQLIMHANSFDAQYDCDENLLHYSVPNFILQPAVENAILHGIDPLSERRGILHIVLKKQDGCILVDICDNGVGITAEQQQSLNEMLLSDSKHAGYGLRNVQERIQLVFGAEYGLSLSGKPGEGCIVRFRLPFCEK